jgi:acyl transferase domain-containing protein/acyl carrier protein
MTVTSIFTPLITGNAILVYNEKENKQILIDRIIDDNRVEVLKVTPSHLKLVGDKKIYYLCPSIKRFIVGGEELKTSLAKKIFENFGNNIEIYNEYGPTEAAVGCMIYKFDYKKDTRESVPIGHPADNTQIYILDKNLAPIPPGIIGEIYISGDGIARGYLNQPELTEERFINFNLKRNQGHKGKGLEKYHLTLYRTGDLSRWLPGGAIEFLGRIDHQVKIRGFRIELREIENHLLNHPGIKEAVVTVKKDRDNENYLCGWVVMGKDRPAPELSDLKTYLSQKLPHYMVPTYIIPLERLPLTRTGKVDTKTLSEAEINRSQIKQTYMAPQTDVEKIIVRAWKQVLKIDKVGVDDNFFDLGGNSLSIIRLNTKLKEIFKQDIPVVTLFNYPTVGAQARYFGGEAAAQPVVTTKPAVSGDIAVIGMAGRFPGAQNIEEFWDNLKKGKESITFFTDEELETLGVNPGLYHHPHYVKAKGVLESMEYFDALFFDYSAREARLMDPQLRLLHECVWEALENAGYVPGSSNGSIGLYVGSLSNTWWMQRLNKEINSHSDLLAVGSLNDRDYLATRISYKLNLKGPAVTVQTACSTSLVAIDTACQALLGGRCRIALAGGISLTFQDRAGYLYEDGMVRSPDGHCRPFDAGARGTMGGNGVGIVVLKPLKEAAADGDNIRAMIKGSAINNDGARKVGYTAPSVEGQVEVVRSALKAAGIEPESVTYLETHGTGTILGDPVEIEALKQAFNTDKKGFCGIGAVKANIGHLDAAAGAAGFIKTVLALEYRMIPPLVNFQTPNPQIDFENSPFYVNTQFKKWENEIYPLRAGVSSFGLGGTNAHVILEEWPRKREHKTGRREYQLILLSAKTQPALEKMSLNLARYLQENPHLYLQDVAYTLQVGRETFQHRRMVVCSCIDAAIESLSGSNPGKVCSSLVEDGKQQLIFMFPGLGCQYVNMGRDIYEKEPFFRREMDRCFEILASLLDYNIKEILYPDESAKKSGHEENTKEKGIGNRPAGSEGPHSSSFNIHHFEVAQIVIFIFEYALAKLLLKWGIRPQNMIGYSFGEYAAACISGVFSLEDALKLVVARGRLMKKIPPGAMMSVPLPSEKLIPLLPKDLSIAVDNGPSCVVSGPVPAVDAFEKQMKKMRCICMRLPVTHAVHSKMIEPVLEEFKCELRCICLNNPQINYISNVTGQLIKDREVTDPGYWLTHLRETVQFADGLKKLLEEDNAIFIEIGPGRELSAFVQKFITPESHHFTINLIKHASEEVPDHRYLVERIGYLWLYGVSIDWPGFYWGWGEKQRISLPPYPFERQRYWIEEKQPGGDVETLPPKSLVNRKKNIEDWFYIPSWKRSILSLRDNDDPPGAFTCLVFVNECRFCELVVKELVNEGHEVMTVRIGPGFQKENDYTYTINPQQRADYDILLQHLFSTEKIPEKIVHMWNITNIGQGQIGIETISETQYLGFYSLLYLTIAMGQQDFARECQVTVLTNNMQELAGEEWLCPEKATLIGPVRVIPKEYSNINCRSIDILVPGPGSLRERKILNMLRQELRSKITDPVIAYRGNHRWVQSFEPVRLDKTGVDAVRLRKNGVYLITGGLGGIGFAIAQYLLKEFQARLIIVGRTALPLRQDWEKWLAEHEADNQMSQKIRKVLELETLGGEIFLAAADVSVFVQMQKVIAEARKQFGPIQGVIHAAGLPGSSVIQRKTWEMTEPVLAPKVKGTLVLDRLLRDEQLDFFILFSSIDSIIATFGQVDYTAANSFLDAFAHNKASRDGTFCVSINWQGWAEVGMSHRADMKLADELNISPDGGRISPPEGINAFARILENNLIQVVVNVQDFIESVEQNKSSRISELAKSLEKVQSAKVTHSRPRLSSSYIAPSNRTEKLLAEMWQTFFGFECIGVDDNFFELGATSLDLVQLNSRLKDKFKREIPIEKMFTYPTINTLAGYLEGNQEESDNITDHQELERLEVMAESKNRLKRRKKNLREKIVND